MALQSTTAIATITLQQASSTVTFSGIPNTYRDLLLVVDGGVSTNQNCYIYMNEDTNSANYSKVEAGGDGSSAFGGASSSALWFTMTTSGANTIVEVLDYSVTDKHKSAVVRVNYTTAVYMLAGRWASQNAVDSLRLNTSTGTFNSGTTFSLYGRIA